MMELKDHYKDLKFTVAKQQKDMGGSTAAQQENIQVCTADLDVRQAWQVAGTLFSSLPYCSFPVSTMYLSFVCLGLHSGCGRCLPSQALLALRGVHKHGRRI